MPELIAPHGGRLNERRVTGDAAEAHREEIDKLISTTAENWKIHRMLPVDRNLLRIGTYEMRFAADADMFRTNLIRILESNSSAR